MREIQKMSITIREILEGIAILSAMIAVIAIPNPAEAVEPCDSFCIYRTGD
jgi:hypothetical protein